MSSTPPKQIISTSIDTSNISVIASPRSPTDPRFGSIYDPTFLAAGTPIYFHGIDAKNFIAIFSERWTDATSSDTNPAAFTEFTESSDPSWFRVNSVSGKAAPINGDHSIPMPTTHDSRVVIAASSRPPNYLYLLNEVTNGAVKTAVVQHFMIVDDGMVKLFSEETIPTISYVDSEDVSHTVVFSKGIIYASPNLIFVGTDSNDVVHLARKPWGKIGSSSSWEYQTAKGWSVDPSEISSVSLTSGDPLTTVGPCSSVSYRGRTWLSTVSAVDTTMSAKIHVAQGMKWEEKSSVALGDSETSYMGGLYLQPLLGANPQSTLLADQSNVAAIPYVFYTKTIGEESSIEATWGLHPISRVF